MYRFYLSAGNRISNRIHELEQMPANMNVELRTQALIELKSLKLLQFQKQLRHEVLNTMKVCSFFFISFIFLLTSFFLITERYLNSNSTQSSCL